MKDNYKRFTKLLLEKKKELSQSTGIYLKIKYPFEKKSDFTLVVFSQCHLQVYTEKHHFNMSAMFFAGYAVKVIRRENWQKCGHFRWI